MIFFSHGLNIILSKLDDCDYLHETLGESNNSTTTKLGENESGHVTHAHFTRSAPGIVNNLYAE